MGVDRPSLKQARALNKVDCTYSKGYSSHRWLDRRVEFGSTHGGDGQTRQSIGRTQEYGKDKTEDVTAERKRQTSTLGH